MHADQHVVGRARRLVARKHLESFGLQGPLDDAVAVRALGMALAHVVLQTGGMGDEKGCQGFLPGGRL